MLEGLDRVDWSGLRHAYGTAEDVPALIRALISPSEDERGAAITELYGNLWHQGTIYEATSYAVPFLIELIGSDKTPARHEILSYLGTLADGTSFADVHKGSMRLLEEELSARLERELHWVEQTRRAVKSGEALYFATLRSREHLPCCAAAYVLSRFPEEGNRYWTPLRERYEAAHDDALVRCGIAILTKEFSATGAVDGPWLAAMLEQESLLSVRIPLAVSIAASDQAPGEDILRFLSANLLVDNEFKQLCHAQPFDSGDVVSDIVKALCASNRGTRMLISRFNQLLAEGAQYKRLEYVRYLLREERAGEVDGHELEGPMRPLTIPDK